MFTNWLPLSGVDKLGFQSKAQVSPSISGDNFRLIPPNCMVSYAFVLLQS